MIWTIAAPLPRVIVDESVRRPVLAGEHAGGRGVIHDAALERLDRRRLEDRRERRIVERRVGDAAGIVDGEQTVARAVDASQR